MDQDNRNLALSNGQKIPRVALGTLKTDKDLKQLENAIKCAIQAGYRHFDTATFYQNEEIIGSALRAAIAESDGKLKREDFFVTTKVWNTHHSKEQTRSAFEASFAKLGLDYIDLFLLHWPVGFKENTGVLLPADDNGNRLFSDIDYLETYNTMEEFYKQGRVKSLGVSNFNTSQLQRVLDNCKVKPVLNQIEVHPYLQNETLVNFCQAHDVAVSAYGPLGAGMTSASVPGVPTLLQNETLTKIGYKHNKTTAQVCLRWLIQRNIVVLPKSITPSRIVENFQVFDFSLSSDEMNEIRGINQNLRLFPANSMKSHKFFPFNQD